MAEYVFKFKEGDIIDADTQFVIMSKIPTETIISNMTEVEKVLRNTEIIITVDD